MRIAITLANNGKELGRTRLIRRIQLVYQCSGKIVFNEEAERLLNNLLSVHKLIRKFFPEDDSIHLIFFALKYLIRQHFPHSDVANFVAIISLESAKAHSLVASSKWRFFKPEVTGDFEFSWACGQDDSSLDFAQQYSTKVQEIAQAVRGAKTIGESAYFALLAAFYTCLTIDKAENVGLCEQIFSEKNEALIAAAKKCTKTAKSLASKVLQKVFNQMLKLRSTNLQTPLRRVGAATRLEVATDLTMIKKLVGTEDALEASSETNREVTTAEGGGRVFRYSISGDSTPYQASQGFAKR